MSGVLRGAVELSRSRVEVEAEEKSSTSAVCRDWAGSANGDNRVSEVGPLIGNVDTGKTRSPIGDVDAGGTESPIGDVDTGCYVLIRNVIELDNI